MTLIKNSTSLGVASLCFRDDRKGKKKPYVCLVQPNGGSCRRFWVAGEPKAANPHDWLCNAASERDSQERNVNQSFRRASDIPDFVSLRHLIKQEIAFPGSSGISAQISASSAS